MTKRMALVDSTNNKVLQIIVTEDDWTGGNWYETIMSGMSLYISQIILKVGCLELMKSITVNGGY